MSNVIKAAAYFLPLPSVPEALLKAQYFINDSKGFIAEGVTVDASDYFSLILVLGLNKGNTVELERTTAERFGLDIEGIAKSLSKYQKCYVNVKGNNIRVVRRSLLGKSLHVEFEPEFRNNLGDTVSMFAYHLIKADCFK